MSAQPATVSLLVFEAADCLMAVPAEEIKQLDRRSTIDDRRSWDLNEYFTGRGCDGPWLCWRRGARSAWLRVRRVVDVVPVALSALKPLPRLLRAQSATNAFLAAGIRDDEVFLVLDPARLGAALTIEAGR
jgi:hypothetical protein